MTAALEVTGLCKALGGRALLDQLTLTVAAGETVAIVGESGAGKSTLLHILAGIEPFDQGHISIAGQSLEALNRDEAAVFRRRHIGLVFQSFYLLPHLSVEQNIALPWMLDNRAPDTDRISHLLRSVGLNHRAGAKPRELSGGEQQRVALARALALKPALILADEPTGNLDSDNADKSLSLLLDQTRAEGCAVVMVTHSNHAAENCMRRLTLHHGQLHQH